MRWWNRKEKELHNIFYKYSSAAERGIHHNQFDYTILFTDIYFYKERTVDHVETMEITPSS